MKMQSRFDQAHRQNAIDLYQAGLSLCDVAAQCGCDPASVCNWLIKAGIPRRPRVRPRTLHRYVDAHGYPRVRCPGHRRSDANGFVKEHVLVYENAHGPVAKGFDIHHRNGIKSDNRLENLECLPKGHHMSLTRREDLGGGNRLDPRVVRAKIGLRVAHHLMDGFVANPAWYGFYDGKWNGKRVEVKTSRMARTDPFRRWRFSFKGGDRFDLLLCVLLDDAEVPICAYLLPVEIVPGRNSKTSGLWMRPQQERFSQYRIDAMRWVELPPEEDAEDPVPF
jgi:hypothetical protein